MQPGAEGHLLTPLAKARKNFLEILYGVLSLMFK